MNILITGGNGYIAKSLYEALKRKHSVMLINRENFDLTNKEATDIFFKHRLFDIVIHCAVRGGNRLNEDSMKEMDDNLRMYYNLLDNSNHFDRFIHFGSGAEIYAEDTPYGLSKKVIRESIRQKPNFYNLRIFGVFDENELDTRFIKSNIKRYISKETIRVYENKQMDFIYMPDLTKIVEHYIENDNLPKEINCNYETRKYLLDIANIINNLDNHKVEIVIDKINLNDYVSKTYNYLPIDYIGLENGIKEVYQKLKNGK